MAWASQTVARTSKACTNDQPRGLGMSPGQRTIRVPHFEETIHGSADCPHRPTGIPTHATRFCAHAAARPLRGTSACSSSTGKTTHAGHGAVLKSMSKAVRQRLRQVLTRHEYAEAERYFCVYAVVSSDQEIVTAAHRTHRRFH